MNPNLKLTLFWLSFLVIGALLALFLGIGWLFLLLTLRRAVVFIPPLENKLRKHLLGLPPIRPAADPQMQRIRLVLGIVTLIAWTALTALAFVQLNVPLIQIFTGSR